MLAAALDLWESEQAGISPTPSTNRCNARHFPGPPLLQPQHPDTEPQPSPAGATRAEGILVCWST